jgi:hypothetical protein
MTNIYYIAQKRAGSEVARLCVKKLLETPGLKFLSVDEQVLRTAEASEVTDFEDAVQAVNANARWSSTYPFFSIFAHESRKDAVRLNTNLFGLESTASTQK